VLDVIGDGEEGMEDGPFETATLNQPRGMALGGGPDGEDLLYIADTENHAIRMAHLSERSLVTIAGTGRQADVPNQAGPGGITPLSSPWDLTLHDGTLFLAMAGTHQIWRLDLSNAYVAPYAGSGVEARIDGPLHLAALAQPSGITTDGKKLLYFADSEVSSIRSADINGDGLVHTIVGGDLFEFGDVDGRGLDVRLQHPIGLTWHEGVLFVADTYNHKIKRIRIEDGTCESFLGDGQHGSDDGLENPRFHEPEGLSAVGASLYIADTNNHAIRLADIGTGRVRTLELRMASSPLPGAPLPP